MSPADGVTTQSNSFQIPPLKVPPSPVPLISESYAKDSIIAWFRGEFAAANAIIDALCGHLIHLDGRADAPSEYASAFEAIHRRRLNWIPVLQMQKYFSIADVALELRKVADRKAKLVDDEEPLNDEPREREVGNSAVADGKSKVAGDGDPVVADQTAEGEAIIDDSNREDSHESDITDAGSQGVQPFIENNDICVNHVDCEERVAQFKLTKGFIAKEPVKGRMVNVVRGLKLYENVFTDAELSKLINFVDELHVAGRNGELPGETFISYNQQLKGSKREMIQFGTPIFGQVNECMGDHCQKSHMEPIPALLQDVTDHLVQWHLISENSRPNSCIINFFNEGEHSQPFLKPPHLEKPILMLLLSESTMVFGRALVSDADGNYKGPLTLSLHEGSLLVMRGQSADTARHVMCPSSNKRVSIMFFKVRVEIPNDLSAVPPLTGAMTIWQPQISTAYTIPNGICNETIDMIPKWGVFRNPVVMLSPVVRPMVLNPKKMANCGTGVFFPWTVGSRKHAKHLPPRARKGRLLALPPPIETRNGKPTPTPGTNIEDNQH